MNVSELASKIKSLPQDHQVTGLKVTRGELLADEKGELKNQEVTLVIYHKAPTEPKGRRTMFVFPLPAHLAESEKPLKHRPFANLRVQ